jgi:2,3-bisphosphoglycerate-independent phosphoglycerate mutase
MVGHTGVLEAGIKAVEAVDRELGLIRQSAKENNYAFILTSDHGNCEEMRDKNGEILTNHTVGDVWCFIEATGVKNIKNGGLNNIAPSVLKIMGLPIPPEMDEALF